MEIALISEELFKENSPIKEDTIITKFVPYIGITQRVYLDKVLGKPLVEELQGQIKEAQDNPDADPYPITPANQALLQRIAPPLCPSTLFIRAYLFIGHLLLTKVLPFGKVRTAKPWT